jgi:hypothetical protein
MQDVNWPGTILARARDAPARYIERRSSPGAHTHEGEPPMPALVPVNLSVSDLHISANLPAGNDLPDELKQGPPASALNNWQQEQYSLDVTAAASLGFPLGSIQSNFRHQVLMFGSSRWTDVVSGKYSYRFGVALRALIIVTDSKANGDLNVASVAAKVQVGEATAMAQLLVRGYKGSSLADQLPAWQSFDVAAYGDYMKAISNMQRQVEQDDTNIVPELIWTTVNAQSLPPATAAVGSVFAYHAISEGKSYSEALQHLPTAEVAVVDAVRAVYLARIGQNELEVPSFRKAERACRSRTGRVISPTRPSTSSGHTACRSCRPAWPERTACMCSAHATRSTASPMQSS